MEEKLSSRAGLIGDVGVDVYLKPLKLIDFGDSYSTHLVNL